MRKEIKREITIWAVIVAVTLVVTSVFAVDNESVEVVETRKDLAIAYESSYNIATGAKDLFDKKKYLEIQPKIDEGRGWITKLKSLTEENSPESIAGNTWSVILDGVQEGLIKLVSEKTNEIKNFEGDKESKNVLVKEVDEIIVMLEKSSIEKTKIEADKLRIEFNKVIDE